MKVFYDPRQTAAYNKSRSPSAQKPALVMDAWVRDHGTDIEVMPVKPAGPVEIARAHSPKYVREVLTLKANNGFGNAYKTVRDTFPYTVGSLRSAVEHAMLTGEGAASPTSGFHHADYFGGGGYCTFNGLVIAALRAVEMGANRVVILDADMHFGDGTDQILKHLWKHGDDELRSMVAKIHHRTIGGEEWSASTAGLFLHQLWDWLDRELPDTDVLIYQAGADPHVLDPLGGWLTTAELKMRDRLVFEAAKHYGVPVVWNLAGGYQKDIQNVIDIHRNTMDEAIRAERMVEPVALAS